ETDVIDVGYHPVATGAAAENDATGLGSEAGFETAFRSEFHTFPEHFHVTGIGHLSAEGFPGEVLNPEGPEEVTFEPGRLGGCAIDIIDVTVLIHVSTGTGLHGEVVVGIVC